MVHRAHKLLTWPIAGGPLPRMTLQLFPSANHSLFTVIAWSTTQSFDAYFELFHFTVVGLHKQSRIINKDL